MLRTNYYEDTKRQHKVQMQTMPPVSDHNTIRAHVTMFTRESDRIVGLVLNFDLQRTARERRLQSFFDVLRQIARSEPPSEQLFTDPLSRYRRIRYAIKQISLPRSYMEFDGFPHSGMGAKSMAAWLYKNWQRVTGLDPIHNQLHHEIPHPGRSKATPGEIYEATAWRRCYAILGNQSEKEQPRFTGPAHTFESHWQDVHCKQCDENCIHTGIQSGPGQRRCVWNKITGELFTLCN